MLRALAPVLASHLHGFTCVSCFCQQKDELVLEFHNRHRSFFIRAMLDPSFSCLSFPRTFARARKNSIDLFAEAVMQPVQSVSVLSHERSLILSLDTHALWFKMHGNRSNVLLLRGDAVVDVFRKQLHSDRHLQVAALARVIDWSRPHFEKSLDRLPQTYNVLGPTVWAYLAAQGFDLASAEEKWNLFNACIQQLGQPAFYQVDERGLPALSLLPWPNAQRMWPDPVEALNGFSAAYHAAAAFAKARAGLLAALAQREKKLEKALDAVQTQLNALEHTRHYRLWADLIMAHLHQIVPGDTGLTAPSLYDPDTTVTVPLKPDITPQKNAALYYRKSKNQSIEIKQLTDTLRSREQSLRQIRIQQQQAAQAQQLRDLPHVAPGQQQNPDAPCPYHLHEYQGYQILIGKNAAANDAMLRLHAHKNDLWLHARDTPGSHVIVRQRAGHPFPKTVMEAAASWAAYHSKRKNEALVPVACTLCKYVRKRKGDAPGAVVIEKETTLLVPPAAP